MREVVADIDRWREEGAAVALATVVKTWGSAPRKAGAKMAMASGNRISGSVSGGCVENAAYETGLETLASGNAQLLHFGVTDETAWGVGLACGGSITILVEPLRDPVYAAARAVVVQDGAGVIVTVLSAGAWFGRKRVYRPSGAVGSIGSALDHEIDAHAAQAVRSGKSQTLSILHPVTGESLDLFLDALLPAPQLIMVGGVHIAQVLTGMAKMLGFRTIVVDPRRAFGTDARFPDADKLVQLWPQKAFAQLEVNENTAIALLTHDPKIDDPAIAAAIASPAFYIGALGSRTTHAKRVGRLRDAGFSDAQIGRIRGPIGIDINAQNPEEIALSILAEIVAIRRGALS
ncbi:MAG: XdhC/CoxI family protein [Anaerolineae bacterium]|nr:XdhC/CoxI family protein [Anaerolineae bacterium]